MFHHNNKTHLTCPFRHILALRYLLRCFTRGFRCSFLRCGVRPLFLAIWYVIPRFPSSFSSSSTVLSSSSSFSPVEEDTWESSSWMCPTVFLSTNTHWRVAENILNKVWTADKGWSSILSAGWGTNNPLPQTLNMLQNVWQSLGFEQILWNDVSNRQ